MLYPIIVDKKFTAAKKTHRIIGIAAKGRVMFINTLKWSGTPLPKIKGKEMDIPAGSIEIVKRVTEKGTFFDLLPPVGDTL